MKVNNNSNHVERIENVEIRYTFKPARKDCNHLVVLFNGYRRTGWDFQNSMSFVKCHLLLIEDNHLDKQAYYLGDNKKFNFADSVNQLIEKTLQNLNLSKDHCTLWGASKGGFAALFIGLKYNYKNIVAPSFVGHIGSRMAYFRSEIANHVMGDYNDDVIAEYNNLLVKTIKEDINHKKNIYVFISTHDIFYKEFGQFEAILELSKYENFNMFITDSKLAYQHDQVATYYLQEILSVITLLSQGIVTKLDEHVFNGKKIGLSNFPTPDTSKYFNEKNNFKEKSVNEVSKLTIKNSSLFIEGLAFIQNYSSPSYKFLSKKLALFDLISKVTKEYKLGSVPQKTQTRSLFSGKMVDYTASGFATMGFKGIDLDNLPLGVYKILISTTKDSGKADYQDLNLTHNFDGKYLSSEFEYRIYSKNNSVYLTKRESIGRFLQKESYFFELKEAPYIANKNIYIKGDFLVTGVDFSEFSDGEYYFILKNKSTGKSNSFLLGKVKNIALVKKLGLIYGGYDICSFDTPHSKGIDVSKLEIGEYDIYISLSYKSDIFTHQLSNTLSVINEGFFLSIEKSL